MAHSSHIQYRNDAIHQAKTLSTIDYLANSVNQQNQQMTQAQRNKQVMKTINQTKSNLSMAGSMHTNRTINSHFFANETMKQVGKHFHYSSQPRQSSFHNANQKQLDVAMNGYGVQSNQVYPQNSDGGTFQSIQRKLNRKYREKVDKASGNREMVFSVSKPIQQSLANTKRVMENQKYKNFDDQQQVEEMDFSVTKEIEQLLNNFLEEQSRIMKMQNRESETDNDELLKKIYNIEKGSSFLKSKRSGIGGINPILRFLSDEKSVLYKHLQSKDLPLQMNKETFYKILMEKGSKYLPLNAKKEYRNALKTERNNKAELHVKKFDFPQTSNPYFVHSTIQGDEAQSFQNTGHLGGNSPLSNDFLNKEQRSQIFVKGQVSRDGNERILKLLEKPKLHQQINEKFLCHKFAKVRNKQGIEQIIQHANKNRQILKHTIATDQKNLPNVMRELEQLQIIGDSANQPTPSITSTINTGRENVALWTSRISSNKQINDKPEDDQQANKHANSNYLQQNQTEIVKKTVMNNIMTPSLANIYPQNNMIRYNQELHKQIERNQRNMIGTKQKQMSPRKGNRNITSQVTDRSRITKLNKSDRKRFRSSLGGWQIESQQNSQIQQQKEADMNRVSGDGAQFVHDVTTQNSRAASKGIILRAIINNETPGNDGQKNLASEAFSLNGSNFVDHQNQDANIKILTSNQLRLNVQNQTMMEIKGVQSSLNKPIVKQKIHLTNAKKYSSQDCSKLSERGDQNSLKLEKDVASMRQFAMQNTDPNNDSVRNEGHDILAQQQVVSTKTTQMCEQNAKQDYGHMSTDGSQQDNRSQRRGSIVAENHRFNGKRSNSRMNETINAMEDYQIEGQEQAVSKGSLSSKKHSATFRSTTRVLANPMLENETHQTISPIHSVRVNKEMIEAQLTNRQMQTDLAESIRSSLHSRSKTQITNPFIMDIKSQINPQRIHDQVPELPAQQWQNVNNVHIVFDPETLDPMTMHRQAALQNCINVNNSTDDSYQSRFVLAPRTAGAGPLVGPNGTQNPYQSVYNDRQYQSLVNPYRIIQQGFQGRRSTAPMMRRFLNQQTFRSRRRTTEMPFIPHNDKSTNSQSNKNGSQHNPIPTNDLTVSSYRAYIQPSAQKNNNFVKIEMDPKQMKQFATPFRNQEEWTAEDRSNEAKDGPITTKRGNWSPGKGDQTSQTNLHDKLNSNAVETPDRIQGKDRFLQNNPNQNLSSTLKLTDGAGHQQVLTGFKALKNDQNQNSKEISIINQQNEVKNQSLPLTPGKQIQLNVKMHQAFQNQKVHAQNKDLNSMCDFGLEERVNVDQSMNETLLKEQNNNIQMLLTIANEIKESSLRHSSRGSQKLPDHMISNQNYVVENEHQTLSMPDSKTKSRIDSQNELTEKNISRTINEIRDDDSKTINTHRNGKQSKKVCYIGFNKSSTQAIAGNNLLQNDQYERQREKRDKKAEVYQSSLKQSSVMNVSRQSPIENSTLIQSSIYFKNSPVSVRSKSKQQGKTSVVAFGPQSKNQGKPQNQDLKVAQGENMKSESFQVKVIKYPNALKVVGINNKSPPKYPPRSKSQMPQRGNAQGKMPQIQKGLHQQIQTNHEIDTLTLGGSTQQRPRSKTRIRSPTSATIPLNQKQTAPPLPHQALILYQRTHKQKLDNLKLNTQGLLIQQNEEMRLPTCKHLKKQNKLKRVLETLSKRKALVIDEQKIFQMLFEEETKHFRIPSPEKSFNINLNHQCNANILCLHADSPKQTNDQALGTSDAPPDYFKQIFGSPHNQSNSPSKASTVDFVNNKAKKSRLPAGAFSAQRSKDLELQIPSEEDGFNAKSPMHVKSESGELQPITYDLNGAKLEDMKFEMSRLNMLKHQTQKILQKNLNQDNFYQYQNDL